MKERETDMFVELQDRAGLKDMVLEESPINQRLGYSRMGAAQSS